jgi:hypothetical protein
MYGCGAPANTRGCAATTVMQQLRVTDDDDGNLATVRRTRAAIFNAFNRHNITVRRGRGRGEPEHVVLPVAGGPCGHDDGRARAPSS